MGQRLENAKQLYLTAIRDGDYVDAICTYSGERYTQHSTPVKDGKDGFIEFFGEFVQRNPIRDVQIVRAFEDGNFVFLHVLQNLNNGEYQYVTADIFDTDHDAKLIEHWDIIEEMSSTTASGRTQLDGPTKMTDLERTDANKALVEHFVTEVLVDRRYDRIEGFVASDLAQHSAEVADGVEAYQAFLEATRLRCVEVHNIVGSGNFVAVLAEMKRNGERCASIDLYRIDSGQIAEHWDVTETITPEETWVNSGKF
jgi:predicted SnoaL-like aldol condensation-catalyzing enzyme